MAADFESRVRQTGLRLYELIEGQTPSLFDKTYWTGKIVDWCMEHQNFKVAMFRFIDVLPCLTRPEAVSRHLVEYFCDPGQGLPAALRVGLGCSAQAPAAAKLASEQVAKNIETLGRRFIAGVAPKEALPALSGLRSQGMGFSADLLGETVVSEKEAAETLDRYLELFDVLDQAQIGWAPLGAAIGDLDWGCSPKINVSIKPSALYSQMTPRAFDYSISCAKDRLRPLFRKAIQVGAHVCLDMEHHELKGLTLALYKSLMEEREFRDYPHTGAVIQSYLRESEGDLKDLLQWCKKGKRRMTIRLVKGAYWDAEIVWAGQKNWPAPVFIEKLETDGNFERLAAYLMKQHEWVNLACASHNIRSIACVIELAKDLKVPFDRLEYQVLYGMAEPVRTALRKEGLRVRVYTPMGETIPGMAYLIRRLLENTSNESFLRQHFVEGISRQELLANPLQRLRDAPRRQRAPGSSAMSGKLGSKAEPFENEPPMDWTEGGHRDRFGAALREVKNKLPYRVPLCVGGNKVHAKAQMRRANPNAPQEVVGIITCAEQTDAQKAVAAAAQAFPAWRDRPPEERAHFLFDAAKAAREQRYALAALEVLEVGKNWSEADADVCEAIDFLEYYGREMIRLGTPRRMGEVPGEKSRLFYEPRGVAAVISPWNFPLAISMGMTSAALVAGNTVVLKPSPYSSVTGSMVCRVFEQAQLPSGVLNFIPGGGDIGSFLVGHPQVALIAFTGSPAVGCRIIEAAAKTPEGATHVKHVVAEMGGKNAVIVDEDADLDEAVMHIMQSAFGYQGQKCSACSRLIVLAQIHDRLLDRLKAAAESVELGPTEDPKTFMGAVIDETAKEKILRYIEIGKREAKLVLQRDLPGATGHFVPLTIFAEVRPGHQIAREEIFGPVLAVIRVRDFSEALETANSTPYALTGAVFSRSPANIALAERAFRVGNLYINRGCTGAIVGRHPFGGFKMSGLGSKAGGPDYLLQFMVPRNVAENTLRRGFAPDQQASSVEDCE